MDVWDAVWAASAYLAGTVPFALIVARARGARAVVAASDRRAGEADLHVLMAKRLGILWGALAAGLDVAKGALPVLVARHWGGGLGRPSLALVGIAAVVGHAFPFYARDSAGRGLAAAAGVYLVLLPAQMVLAGVVISAGWAARATGVATTVAMAGVPFAAWWRDQPLAYGAMSAAILVLLLVRRAEGVGRVVEAGVPRWRALVDRCVFDSSGRAAHVRPASGPGGGERPRTLPS